MQPVHRLRHLDSLPTQPGSTEGGGKLKAVKFKPQRVLIMSICSFCEVSELENVAGQPP
jgi:hypothetical protein